MFFNFNDILSRNSLYNFILTGRGYGKTYGSKKFCIKKFLKTGEQWIYVRRYKTEMEDMTLYFDDIKHEFPKHEFNASKKMGMIDGKVCCYFIPLSTQHNKKSTSYPKVTTLIFDEFVIDKKKTRYLNNEVEAFNDLFETVARKRDNVRALFLANNITLANPYFLYFNILPNFKKGIKSYQDNLISVQLDDDKEFIESKKQTRFGRLIQNTNYGKYAIENKELKNNGDFINESVPKDMRFIFSIKYKDFEVGIWRKKDGSFYVYDKLINTSKLRFALTKDDFTSDVRMIENINRSNLYYCFKESFKKGQVEFQNSIIKEQVYDIFRFTGIK